MVPLEGASSVKLMPAVSNYLRRDRLIAAWRKLGDVGSDLERPRLYKIVWEDVHVKVSPNEYWLISETFILATPSRREDKGIYLGQLARGVSGEKIAMSGEEEIRADGRRACCGGN